MPWQLELPVVARAASPARASARICCVAGWHAPCVIEGDPVRVVCLVVGLLLVASTEAHALKPRVHASITEDSCRAHGLPTTFCVRVATEDYNVDDREWDDLEAHAQIGDGDTACHAADRTVEYVRQRGDELRAALDAIAAGSRDDSTVGDAGHALGRVLHAVQDHCAHHGMPNPQHAWFSMHDFCEEGEDLSPDVQHDALACARRETDAIMSLVATAVRARGVARPLADHSCPEDPWGDEGSRPTPICQARYLPSLFEACDFLASAEDWDGIDRQWRGSVVTAALRHALSAGLAGSGPLAPVCGGDERVLSAGVSEPIVDVSGGPPLCNRLQLFCLGKLDGDVHPFADDDVPDELFEDEPAAGAGCSAGSRPAGLLLVLAPLGPLVLLRRRLRARAAWR